MKLKQLLSIFMTLILFARCTENIDGYKIDGHINGMMNETIYLEYLSPTAATSIDTATTDDNGNFKMMGKVIEKGFHRIRNEQGNKSWIILVENKSFDFEADYMDPKLRDISISNYPEGSNLQESINFFATQQEEVQAKAMELQQSMMNPNADPMLRKAAQEELGNLESLMTQKFKDKINEVKDDNPFSVIYLISAINPQTEGDYLKEMIQELANKLPNSTYIENLKQSLAQMEEQEELKKLSEMNAAEEIEDKDSQESREIVMNDVKGESLKLSDLKGKVVLVDFWASWCKPCRAENPNVVRMYHQYKSKGFDIFSVSLDNDLAKWKNAIAKDGLVWENHVSDLRGWSNAAAKDWGVRSIPATFLLDEEGKIIAKNLRGAALESKLKEIL